MKALRRFTVRASLPPQLSALSDLVMNLRWTWHPDTLDLFEAVDPRRWQECKGDPVRMLGAVSAERLNSLARDEEFVARVGAAAADLDSYLTGERWYQAHVAQHEHAPRSIAYFSPEYGLTEVLPQYSGGLGILAGDHLKAASDLGVPIIGVGLLYRAGYFSQSLSADGWQQEHYPPVDPHGMPLALVRDAEGAPLHVQVGLPEHRTLRAQVWKAQVGRVPLLLLDSDIEDNDAPERQVTDRLYGGSSDHRLEQEMLLGIGGVRAVRAYCALTGTPAPDVFHTNEGHAGFLGVERIRELVEDAGLSFEEALQAVRAGTVFTTHTPVPAGIDRFGLDQVGRYFGGPNEAPGVPAWRIVELGTELDPHCFNMAFMGLRLAQRANGVSRLHGEVSRRMFNVLWSGYEPDEVPIAHVTNGVHAPTWMAREIVRVAEREAGRDALASGAGWGVVDTVSADEIWGVRRVLREQLVEEVRARLRASWLRRGASEAELGWIDGVFDPDVLTIGFARRVPSYKRLTLMLRDRDRLTELLLDPERPMQVVIAGKSHPADDSGKALIQQMVRFTDDPAVRHRIVFLPDYDMGLAKYLVTGCDVWLNNPLRPLEASGTSGMKSALNGGLNLSIRDGWWDEMYDGRNGWAIPTADGVTDPERRDDLEATAFYDMVESQVKANFYDRDPAGVPTRWVEMVRHTLKSLGPKVLASRMVRDYVRDLYTPAAASSARMADDGFAGARRLAHWRGQVLERWSGVRVQHVESSGVGDTPELGATLSLRAEVDLAGLAPDDVEVQAAYGRVNEHDELRDVRVVAMKYVGNGDLYRFEACVPLDHTGPFGYTVRVLPRHDLLGGQGDLAVVAHA